jgi:ribosomal protein L37AE/L43A
MLEFVRLYKKPTTCKQCPKHGEKKRKDTVFGCVKCNKHFFSFICQIPYDAVLDVNIVEE